VRFVNRRGAAREGMVALVLSAVGETWRFEVLCRPVWMGPLHCSFPLLTPHRNSVAKGGSVCRQRNKGGMGRLARMLPP